MQTLEPIIAELPFFRDLSAAQLALIAGCAANVRYEQGEFAGRAGDPADHFWVVRSGRVSLQIFVPGRGALSIATMSAGDVLGFSWLLPPYQLRFDLQALTPTRALLFDGRCLRNKCEADPALGYQILGHFGRVMAQRIEAMSLQLIDVYGDHAETQH